MSVVTTPEVCDYTKRGVLPVSILSGPKGLTLVRLNSEFRMSMGFLCSPWLVTQQYVLGSRDSLPDFVATFSLIDLVLICNF